MTRHLLFLICAWSASIVACCIHEGHARAQCSKERNDQSQHPHNDANGTKHLRGWQLIRGQNTLPLKHLSSLQVQPRNHQNQVTPTVPPTRKILPAFPYCFKTPQHKGSDIATITRIPTTIPPMEPPHSDAAYASSLQSTDMDGADMESGRLCNSNPNPSAYDESNPFVNQPSRHPVLEHQAGKCKFLQT